VALAAPGDTELQAEVTDELERMLDQYHIYLLPFMVGCNGNEERMRF
jgi:hypothetical protein